MLSGEKDTEDYSLSEQDKDRLQTLLNERKNPKKAGGPGCEPGEIPSALEDEIGLELMEYILDDDDNQYLSSHNMSKHLDTDASNRQIGHRIRMIGDSLGLEKDEVGQFYSSSTTWNLDVLRANNLDKLYNEARKTI